MKIVKRILIVVLVIIAIPFVIALFTKRDYSVEKEILINKPSQEVFDYVKILKNEVYYNKWVMADPNMKREFKGADGTPGFVYAWDGNDHVGAGEQEIKTIIEGKRINSELRFKRPFEGIATTFMTTDSVAAGQTKVRWGMTGTNPYPFNFMNLFMDKSLGESMSESLALLKTEVEKK